MAGVARRRVSSVSARRRRDLAARASAAVDRLRHAEAGDRLRRRQRVRGRAVDRPGLRRPRVLDAGAAAPLRPPAGRPGAVPAQVSGGGGQGRRRRVVDVAAGGRGGARARRDVPDVRRLQVRVVPASGGCRGRVRVVVPGRRRAVSLRPASCRTDGAARRLCSVPVGGVDLPAALHQRAGRVPLSRRPAVDSSTSNRRRTDNCSLECSDVTRPGYRLLTAPRLPVAIVVVVYSK